MTGLVVERDERVVPGTGLAAWVRLGLVAPDVAVCFGRAGGLVRLPADAGRLAVAGVKLTAAPAEDAVPFPVG